MIKAVVFDWGGVLILDPFQRMLTYMARRLHVPREKLGRVYGRLRRNFEQGLISETELYSKLSIWLGLKTIPQGLWEASFRAAYIPKKRIFALAEQLHSNYKIGFLSNTEPPAAAFFRKQKYNMFDATVFSPETGYRKPQKEIYLLVCRKLNIRPEESVFIDNRLNNIKGAKNAGMHAIWFRGEKQLRNELTKLGVSVK